MLDNLEYHFVCWIGRLEAAIATAVHVVLVVPGRDGWWYSGLVSLELESV